ncbi:MAG TPA: hypothetical protein VNE17_08155 [Nitrolancea sp.]|nr:hypothetical protein [Nitrolancea sp.]
MSHDIKLLQALDAFAAQFDAQIENAGSPSSENAIHLFLALGMHSTYAFSPGSIIFEHPFAGGRYDLFVTPLDLLVEVKYRRPIPSGKPLPATQLFGMLLADFNRLAHADVKRRLVILVTDTMGMNYLLRTGRGILPLSLNSQSAISQREVTALPKTASVRSQAGTAWLPIITELIWKHDRAPWHLMAWSITPDRESMSNDDLL